MNILIYIPYSSGICAKNLLHLSLELASTIDKVSILTFDKAILTNAAILNSEVSVLHKKHSYDINNKIGRIGFWRFVNNISIDFKQYDTLVLDNDCSIDGYTFSKKIPSFVLQCTMDVFNATTIITKHRYRGSKYFLYPISQSIYFLEPISQSKYFLRASL